MPKTNKICMYFDKEELDEIYHRLYLVLQSCENKEIKELQIEQEGCQVGCHCEICKESDENEEILSRIIKKIKSRMSQ